MGDTGRAKVDYDDLFARASRTGTNEEFEQVAGEIESLLRSAVDPAERGHLLMCRARVRSNQWRTDYPPGYVPPGRRVFRFRD